MIFLKRNIYFNKFLIILYKYILPLIAILGLMGVASFNNHPLFFNRVVDFIVRIFLSTWFYRLYSSLAKDEKFGINRMYGYSQNDSIGATTYLFGIVFSVFSVFFTSWILYAFININGGLNMLLSLCNGLLIAFSQISRLPNSRWNL